MAIIGNDVIGSTIIGPTKNIQRNLPSGFVNKIQSKTVYFGIFFELQFPSGTKRYWTGHEGKDAFGNTFSPTNGELLGLDKIVYEKRPQAHEVVLNLSPLSSDIKSKVRTDDYQEETAKIWIAALKSDWTLEEDPQLWFTGKMQTDSITYSNDRYLINLKLEQGLISHTRASNLKYSDEDQKQDFPNDTGFEFAENAANSKENIAGLSDLESQRRVDKVRAIGFEEQVVNGQSPRNFVYGKARVKKNFVFRGKDPGENSLWLIMPVADHSVADIEKVWWNNDLVWETGTLQSNFSSCLVNKHLGSDSQSVDSDLDSAFTEVGSDFRLRGVAYITVKLDASQERIQNSAGSNSISALVKGKDDVTDPRDNSTGYTNNWALCYRDWMLNSRFGPGIDSARLPDSDWEQAANISDSALETKDGNIPKYRLNVTMDHDIGKHEAMDVMNSAAAGHVVFAGGNYIPVPGADYSSTESFNESDIQGAINEKNKQNRTERPNRVKGEFKWQDNKYRNRGFKLTDSDAESADNNRIEEITKDFPATINEHRARHLAKAHLLLQRSQRTIQIEGKATMLNLMPGQISELDHPEFWTQENYSVERMETMFVPGNGREGPKILPMIEFRRRDGGEFVWSVDSDDQSTTPRSDIESLSQGGPVGSGSAAGFREWQKALIELADGDIYKNIKPIDKDDDLFIRRMGIVDQDGNQKDDLYVEVYNEFDNVVESTTGGTTARTDQPIYEQDFDLLGNQTNEIVPISFRINNQTGSKAFATAYIEYKT